MRKRTCSLPFDFRKQNERFCFEFLRRRIHVLFNKLQFTIAECLRGKNKVEGEGDRASEQVAAWVETSAGNLGSLRYSV